MLNIQNIVANGTRKSEIFTDGLILKLRPQDTGHIQKINADLGGDPLLVSGHAGAVFGLSFDAAAHAVDEGGLTHVGHAHDHSAQMSAALPLFLVSFHAILQNGADGLGKLVQTLARHAIAENADGMGIGIELDEFFILFGISQRGLVEEQDGGLIPRHFPKLGIAGAYRHTGI